MKTLNPKNNPFGHGKNDKYENVAEEGEIGRAHV